MGHCSCSHNPEEHDPNGRCTAAVEVTHEGQVFFKQCGCTKYREDRPSRYNVTPEDLLKMPIVNPYVM
jgi:hypothetical protein